jgi:hypothetical protein
VLLPAFESALKALVRFVCSVSKQVGTVRVKKTRLMEHPGPGFDLIETERL